MKKNVITYGTFDLLHYGHIELLRRAKEMANGGVLTVALSTDEFNIEKGKESHFDYSKRLDLLKSIRYVDKVIPEVSWEQKAEDIIKNNIDIFIMGDDWKGKFDSLKNICQVVYLPRTPYVSSTVLRHLRNAGPVKE